MEPTPKSPHRRGLIVEAGVFVALVAAFLLANYLYGRHAPAASGLTAPSPTAAVVSGGGRSNVAAAPSARPTATPAPVPFVVPELGVVFVVPADLDGLKAAVVQPTGQAAAATTVGFSTDDLAVKGCTASAGTLGYLSDASSDTPGETAISRTATTTYYYRPATNACQAEDVASITLKLKQALTGLTPTGSR